MTKVKITIAVTGLNAVDSPGPGIPVIRALKDSKKYDVRIIGLSYEALEPGIYMHDLIEKTYQIPLPSTGQEALFNRLAYINEKEDVQVVIPNFDAELYNFIKLAPRLEKELNIKSVLPTVDQFEERHKSNLNEFGEKYNVNVPKGKMIFSTDEIPVVMQDFDFPVVVKGKFYDASIAYTPEQISSHFHKISAKWGLPIIIQEFVYGSEVNVTAIGDGKGTTLGAVPMRKQFITDKGKAWAGITLDDKSLLETTHEVIKASKWKGPLELEFIKTNEGKYYLLEINPRFPAWMYLAIGAGQNHAESLVDLAFDKETIPFDSYEFGKLFIRYSYDMIVDLKEFEMISTQGEL